MRAYLAPLLWVAEKLESNPFFIYGGKRPLLHQTEVVAKSLFLKPTRVLIADVIGLGKTITALRVLRALDRYRRLSRVLVAVPSVLVDQWIDEMRSMGIKPIVIRRESLDFLAQHRELPAGWYVGSIDTLKQPEYMELLRRSRWDAIIIDEAHKLGIVGRRPNLRWQSLGRLIIESRDAAVLLLSATPHRGKARDYLARLALLDPTLLEAANVSTLARAFDRPEFYQKTHNTILFRRSKDDVNEVYERRPVFKPCVMLAVLVEPNDVERSLLRAVTELATTYLGSYYAYLVDALGWEAGRAQGIVGLLRTLLVKRGLSSPRALVKTFGKLVEKRGRFVELIEKGYSFEEAQRRVAEELERYSKRLDEVLTGDVGEVEEELDEEFDRLASYFDRVLDERLRGRLEEAKEAAEQILSGRVKDSKLETLKRILRLVLRASPSELPDEFRDLASGKAIVFTEFKDTAYYLYEGLRRWAEEEFGDPSIVRVFTSENRGEIEDVKRWLSEGGRRVLVTTDVAGEGLNLQYANVLVNYEITWSPVKLEQRVGRVWRYGQDRVTYVFNLFLADALEREVAEVVFAKLYGISVSVGKLEPILGERVLLSTIRNELLEHAVGGRRAIGGLMPLEIDFGEGKVPLSEPKIIELVARDARAFVEAFVRALRKLVREVRYKRIYPHRADAERVREELRYLTGFGDWGEVLEAEALLARTIAGLLNLEVEERDGAILLRSWEGAVFELPTADPEAFLRRLRDYFKPDGSARCFVYQGDRKEVLLLTEAEVLVGGEVRYREPIGVAADFETGELVVLRGRALVERLSGILQRSIPVDEVFGLDDVLSAIPQIVSSSYSTFYEGGLKGGALRLIESLREYEAVKRRLGGQAFFAVEDPQVSIKEPAFVFLSTAFLPEVEAAPSWEVWGWAEDEAVPVVLNYERLSGREAVRVSGFEHYDVRSVRRGSDGRVLEERLIEVKAKVGRGLGVGLSEEEFRVAREQGDRYWLYIVYGVGTGRPVVLCVRNPAGRLPFRRRVAVERREEYYLSIGGSPP